jgi:hypothetical protein
MATQNEATQRKRVVIIYNADASISGKLRCKSSRLLHVAERERPADRDMALRYLDAYKKLFQAKEEKDAPVCGNCEITHGGLSLTETVAWVAAKKDLESSFHVDVAQLHRDELDERVSTECELVPWWIVAHSRGVSQLRVYVKQNTVRLPTVLLDDGNSVQEIVPRDEINACALVKQGQSTTSMNEQKATLLCESIKASLRKQQQSESKL